MSHDSDYQVAPPVPPVEVVLYGEDGPDHSITVWLTPQSQRALVEATGRHLELTVRGDGDSVPNLLIRLANLTYVAYDIGGRLYLKPPGSGQPREQFRLLVGERVLGADGQSQWSLKAWLRIQRQRLRRTRPVNQKVTLIVRRSTFGYVERLAEEQGVTRTDAINQMLQVGEWIDAYLANEGEVMIRRRSDGIFLPIAFS
jgi:hypothetical protein